MPRCFLLGCLFVFATSAAVADETTDTLVEIRTTSGRKLVGHLEPQSDTRTIYLRVERPGMVLRTRVPTAQLRRIGPHEGSHVLRIEGSGRREKPVADETDAPPQPLLQQASAHSNRVQTLRVNAWLENWDHDATLDGLRLLVTPLSIEGRPVATRGTLNVQLIARRFDGVRINDTVHVVDSWSRPLTPDSFGPEGAIVDLPFQKLDPERDLDVIPVGLLQASLGISGQGTFEAPVIEFWLRPPSYIRDELQLHTGRRTPSK